MSRQLMVRLFVSLLCAGASLVVQAQTCSFTAQRTIKGFWIENGLGLVIVPTQDFDNGYGCTNVKQAIVLQSHPLYKQMHASVMMAMAAGTPINAYACGCQSAWNNTYPIVINLGVGTMPQ